MFQGDPEVARRAESRGEFLPGPGARVRLGLNVGVCGGQESGFRPCRGHWAGLILNSQTLNRNSEAIWSSSPHCTKGGPRAQGGAGRGGSGPEPEGAPRGHGGRMEGPGKKTGTEHLRAPCHLRRPLGAGTLLVAWRGYGGRSGVRAAVLALTPPHPPLPQTPPLTALASAWCPRPPRTSLTVTSATGGKAACVATASVSK